MVYEGEKKLCSGCGGTGTPLGIPEELLASVVCECGGLGWLAL